MRRHRWLDPVLLVVPVAVLLVVGLMTPTAALFPHQGDVELYLRRAAAVVGGAFPYRDFPFEYPPLAILAMVVPYIVSPVGPPDLDTYRWLFLAWEGALLVALGLVLRRTARVGELGIGPTGLAGRLTLLVAAAALPLAWRYDLFPALLAAVAVLASLEGRAAWAGASIGLGALAKLFPLVVLPVAAVRWLAARDLGALTRLGLVGAGIVVIAFAPFAVAAGRGALDFLGFQVGRGLQVESVGGGLAMLEGALRGTGVRLDYTFNAVHVSGGFADLWLAILPVLTLLGFGAIGAVTWGIARESELAAGEVPGSVVVALAAAWILALLTTSKVFSVQYVVWLVPFAALLPRPQLWLAAVICGLSMAVHPWQYERLIAQDLGPIVLLNLRNALVVVLFAWLLLGLASNAGLARGGRLRPAAA